MASTSVHVWLSIDTDTRGRGTQSASLTSKAIRSTGRAAPRSSVMPSADQSVGAAGPGETAVAAGPAGTA